MIKLSLKWINILVIILFFLIVCGDSASAIRIGLYTNTNNSVFIGLSKEGVLYDVKTGETIMSMQKMRGYKLYKRDHSLVIFNGVEETPIKAPFIAIRPAEDKAFVYTKGKWYRGILLVFNTSGGITVVNEVELEDYLMGVVPAEMPARWNIEAHKAQAIAARSYAVANAGKRASLGYDLKDTPEDQAYSGASGETLRTSKAVADTRGIVLCYNDKVIPAYYHASSGGQTVQSGSVWNKNLPFLKSVTAYDFNVPKKGHGVGMSQHGANNLANAGYNAYQILGYFYQNVALKRLY